ncbi:MAG: hypothetical protein K0R18_397 [Bacillales bacterium]|jgi:hypothetical protein|nr:hypothetical protein [Bacillales bacterium]
MIFDQNVENKEVIAHLEQAIGVLDDLSGTPNDLRIFGKINSEQGYELAMEAIELLDKIVKLIKLNTK